MRKFHNTKGVKPHERIAIRGAKKGGRLALPLERLRYQVLDVVGYAAALRFGSGLDLLFELQREPDVQTFCLGHAILLPALISSLRLSRCQPIMRRT